MLSFWSFYNRQNARVFTMKRLLQNKLILLLGVAKFLIPLLTLNSVWELHRDEYLYYQQGLHPALGFLECPSLTAFLAFISSLAGGSAFAIKFWPALFGAATLWVTAEMARELGGKIFAQAIAALGILFSAYMRVHYLFQPNFLEIFFWTLSAYYLLRYINTKQDKFLYLLSAALALGWWSKYSVTFFATAIVLSLLLTRHRRLFAKKAFWMAAAFGLLLITPNILWQYFHKFPLISHMKELRATQLQYVNAGDFIKSQMLMLFPVLFVWLSGLIWLVMNSRYRIIAFMYCTIIVLLIAGNGKGYYSLGAYPMLLAAGGVCLERISNTRIWIRYAAAGLILVLSLPVIPLLLPLQSPPAMAASNQKYNLQKLGLLTWEDLHTHALQQDFADMLGWKELSAKTEKLYHSLPPDQQRDCVIYCRHYGQAGALRYYGEDKDFAARVFSDNGSFLLWIPAELDFKHLIFVGRRLPDKDDEVFNHFEKVTVIDSVTNLLSRQAGDKIIFFQQADSLAVPLAREGLYSMKQQFSR